MTKIEVTDEMVRRSCLFYYGPATALTAGITNRKMMRGILEAALNPPPQPAVPREMTQAGLNTWHGYSADWRLTFHETMARAYLTMKAMEKPEPLPEPHKYERKFGLMALDQRGPFTTRRVGFTFLLKPWEARGDGGRANGGRRKSDPQ